MHEAIKECKESEHPSETDKAAPSDETAERSYGQGNHQETQRPNACPVPDVFQRVCTQVTGEGVEQQPGNAVAIAGQLEMAIGAISVRLRPKLEHAVGENVHDP